MIKDHIKMENVRRLRDKQQARFIDFQKMETMLQDRRSSYLLSGLQRSDNSESTVGLNKQEENKSQFLIQPRGSPPVKIIKKSDFP